MQEKMLQQVMVKPGEITFEEVDKPEPKDGEILLKIQRIGICGSDIHVYHGKHPFTTYPVTQGHEVSAQIVAMGNGVDQKFRIGQNVTVEPQVFCGKCYPCTHGKYNLCEDLKVMGFQTTGAASEYFAVDQSKVDILPDCMDLNEGAMIEPLSVAVHAARRPGDVSGKKIAVIGAGPIGNLVAQAVKSLGAAQVLITDVSDYRLRLAKECGVDFAVNTGKVSFCDALINCFGADKADIIYDCAGNNITINQAIRSARKGSTIILVAVFADMASADLAVLNDHELDLNTTMMYRHEDYVKAIEMVENGQVRLTPLMSKVFPFGQFKQAYEYIDANRETTMKVLVDIQDTSGIDR